MAWCGRAYGFRMRRVAVRLAVFATLPIVTVASAADIGLRGRKLTAVAGSRLVVIARDPNVTLLPDPATTGATLTVVPGVGASGTLAMPAGSEWSVSPLLQRYRNPLAPGGPSLCSAAVIRSGRVLRIVCRGLGGLALPTSGDLEVTLSDGAGTDETMCFAAVTNDGTRLVAENPVWAAGRCPLCQHTLSWGSSGSAPGQFIVPWDAAVDDVSGKIYVVDFGNARVQSFDAFANPLGSFQTGSSQITGIALDPTGSSVYVVDYHSVGRFHPSGTPLATWGSFGGAPGQFVSPEGIAVDGSGNVFVGDTGNARIQKFDGAGTFLTAWGSVGSANGQFTNPRGVATDASGNVYVADSDNHRIQKFDNTGAFLAAWGSHGTATGQFDEPFGVATDAAGNVYVADTLNSRIQKFDPAGNFVKAWGKFGRRASQFHWPFGLTVDAAGNVYVADSRNDRMQKFACP
jgi:DNA-binding beta-propeller fold protein YncE